MSAARRDFARTRDEVEAEINAAAESLDKYGGAGQWPVMSYESGVRQALEWVLGDDDQAPMEG
jgi:hypothetical protein